MAVRYITRCFFIKKADQGEDSRLFTVYTKDFGKLNILGRAIRKIRSKLKSGAEIFCLSEIEFIQGKNRKTMTGAVLIESFPSIRKDLRKLRVARQIAETVDELAVKEENDGATWALLEEVFNKLEKWELKNCEIVYYYFFWNFVAILGYGPEFHDCAINKIKVDCDAVKIIKTFLRKDWPILSRLRITPSHQKLLKIVSEWYYKNITA